jgi:hypothetical protein
MIKLIQNGLFGNNLYEVNNSLMVKRYNSCLKDIGLTPTKLKKFHIDGWGWSPEIAEEQKDHLYLSHGIANPFGIIITPEQEDSAIYMPFHTFDRQIHKMLFKEYRTQIIDITATCGLWFELDQEISAYRSPQDLLMIDFIKINFYSVDRIMNAAKEQRALIREFYDIPQAWSNDELREKIIESSKKYGDLRFRKFEIPNMPFSEVENYFTLGFNGIYVLRSIKNEKPFLVFSNNSSKVSGDDTHGHIEFNITDPQLLSYLYNNDMISNGIGLLKEHPVLAELMKDYILLDAVVKFDSTLKYNELNKTQQKGVIHKILGEHLLPEVYFDLEKLCYSINNDEDLSKISISEELQPFLLHPSDHLQNQQKEVIWHLLCSVNKHNPIITYLFDKSSFYNEYQNWPMQIQEWVIEQILEHKELFNELI